MGTFSAHLFSGLLQALVEPRFMQDGNDGRSVERRQNSDERHAAEIVNIGGGGVLLRTEATVDTNDQLTIELDLVGESKPISVFGTVVRNDARGVGVAFVRISEITSDLIAYLIRKWEREGAHPA